MMFFDATNRMVEYISYKLITDDVRHVLVDMMDAIGAELILVVLFCAGYCIFRMATVQRLSLFIIRGRARGKEKAFEIISGGGGAPQEALAQARSAPRSSVRGASSFASVALLSSPCRDGAGAATADAASSGDQTQLLRLRDAVKGRRPLGAWQALADLLHAGQLVPATCLGSVVQLLRDMDPEGRVLRQLPEKAISEDALGHLLEHAVEGGDVALLLEVGSYCRPRERLNDLWTASCEELLRGLVVCGKSSAVEVFDKLQLEGYAPSESALTSLVAFCVEPRHVLMAEHMVSYCRRVYGRVPLALYAATMKVYSCARLWHKTCSLYEFMQAEGVELDTIVYGCVIKAAVESGQLQLARRLFQESGNPDLLNYMSLIRAAGRERNVAKALSLLRDLEGSPMAVDTTAYNCVLEVCVACGNLPEARGLLRRMELGGHVDVVSYNTYIKALLQGGSLPEVDAVLLEMRRRSLTPNAVTYNSLVKGAVASKDMKRAWQLVGDMEQAGLSPDAFTCSILMKGVKHAPCAEDVDRITSLIRSANVVPDEVLINCLLDTCVRLRDVQRLTQVLDQFKATGIVPSPHAYATLLRAYGHAQRPEMVWELWRELVGACSAGPSEEAFVSMVDACVAAGDIAGAVAVFHEVRERLPQFTRSPTAFAVIVRACAQSSQIPVALDLYGKIKDLVICGKVTYNSLIDALVRQGDMARASELFRDMALNNVSPDLITFSTLIKGHCACGDIEQGLRLLALMQRRGIAPDAILFNSILDGCAHKQMRTLTEHVLHDMEAAGVAPSNFTLSILVKLYSRCGDLDAAISVVDAYPQKYDFKLNAQVYTCLMAACITNGRMPTALQVYDSMKQAGCPSDAKTYKTLLSGCIRHSDLDGAARLTEDALAHSPPVRLDREVSEGVLLLAARRGRGADLAAPLLERLQAAGIVVSERVARSVRRREVAL